MSDEAVAPAILVELADEVGHRTVARMIDLFLECLPQRVRRLGAAMATEEAQDPEEARAAALSLSCSAAMLGAHPLAGAATSYSSGRPVPSTYAELAQVARRTCAALQRWRQVLMHPGVAHGEDLRAALAPGR